MIKTTCLEEDVTRIINDSDEFTSEFGAEKSCYDDLVDYKDYELSFLLPFASVKRQTNEQKNPDGSDISCT